MVLLLWLIPVFVLFLGVAIAAIPAYFALRFRKRAAAVAETKQRKVEDLRDGPAKVKGRIVAHDDLIVSPMSRSECVYYRFTVEEMRTAHHGKHGSHTYWHPIIDDKRFIDVAVDDGTGEAEIRLEQAEVVLKDADRTHSDLFKDPPERLKRLLRERYDTSTKGWFFNKTMRFNEQVLEEGARVVVVGEVEVKRRAPVFRKGEEVPLVVSDHSEQQLGSHYRTRSYLCWGLSAFLFLMFAVFAGASTFFVGIFTAAAWNTPLGPGGMVGGGGGGGGGVNQPAGGGKPAGSDLNAALADLRSPDPGTRQRGAGTLSRMPVDPARRAEVAAALDPLLRDGNDTTAGAALDAVAVWGGPENLTGLQHLLQGGNLGLRRRAIDALATIKDARAADALCEEMKRTDFRAYTAQVLRRMGPLAEGSVARLLENGDIGVRIEALRVLKDIGTPASAPAVQRLTTDPNIAVAQQARETFDAISRRR